MPKPLRRGRPGSSTWAQNCALASEAATKLSSESLPWVADVADNAALPPVPGYERPSVEPEAGAAATPPPEREKPGVELGAGAASALADDLQTCRSALRALLQQQQADLESLMEELWGQSGAGKLPRERPSAHFYVVHEPTDVVAHADDSFVQHAPPFNVFAPISIDSERTFNPTSQKEPGGVDDEAILGMGFSPRACFPTDCWNRKGSKDANGNLSEDRLPLADSRPRKKRNSRNLQTLKASRSSSSSPQSSNIRQVEHTQHTWLMALLKSRRFEMIVTLFVLLNAIFTGCEVHSAAVHAGGVEDGLIEQERLFEIVEVVFLVLFTAELGVRLFAFKCYFFISPTDWSWNLLDTVIVLAMMLEFLVKLVHSAVAAAMSQIALLRVLRVLRVIKVLRVVRVLTFFTELRTLLSCILNSFWSLSWTLAVLLMMFYVFGLVLTQGCLEFFNEEMDRWDEAQFDDLRSHFGRVDATMLSLFEAVADGISWNQLLVALAPLHWGYSLVFLVFIFVAVFAILNVVTGVFVQGAMQRAQLDRESVIFDAMEARESYLMQMSQIFNEMDEDKSGEISKQEFYDAMEDERMDAYFDANGLNVEDVDTLFALLDRDNTGSIDIEEFLNGCLKLRGEAKGLDLAMVQFQAKWLMYYVGNLTTRLSQCSALKDGFKGWRPTPPSCELFSAAFSEREGFGVQRIASTFSLSRGRSLKLPRDGLQ